jgi:hypothetical protein
MKPGQRLNGGGDSAIAEVRGQAASANRAGNCRPRIRTRRITGGRPAIRNVKSDADRPQSAGIGISVAIERRCSAGRTSLCTASASCDCPGFMTQSISIESASKTTSNVDVGANVSSAILTALALVERALRRAVGRTGFIVLLRIHRR